MEQPAREKGSIDSIRSSNASERKQAEKTNKHHSKWAFVYDLDDTSLHLRNRKEEDKLARGRVTCGTTRFKINHSVDAQRRKVVLKLSSKAPRLSLFCDPEQGMDSTKIGSEGLTYDNQSANDYVLLAHLRFDRVSLKSRMLLKAGKVPELHVVSTSHLVPTYS